MKMPRIVWEESDQANPDTKKLAIGGLLLMTGLLTLFLPFIMAVMMITVGALFLFTSTQVKAALAKYIGSGNPTPTSARKRYNAMTGEYEELKKE